MTQLSPIFVENERVLITKGWLRGFPATILEASETGQLLVRVEGVGCELTETVDDGDVELLEHDLYGGRAGLLATKDDPARSPFL